MHLQFQVLRPLFGHGQSWKCKFPSDVRQPAHLERYCVFTAQNYELLLAEFRFRTSEIVSLGVKVQRLPCTRSIGTRVSGKQQLAVKHRERPSQAPGKIHMKAINSSLHSGLLRHCSPEFWFRSFFLMRTASGLVLMARNLGSTSNLF
jgi:hypothetical protein